MRAGAERDLGIFGQLLVHEHPLTEQRTEWRHRAWLAVFVQTAELPFVCEPDRMRMSRLPEPLQIDAQRRGQHSQNWLIVGKTHHGFRPFAARDMRRGGLFLRREGRRMRENRVVRPISIEIIGDNPGNHRALPFCVCPSWLLQQAAFRCSPSGPPLAAPNHVIEALPCRLTYVAMMQRCFVIFFGGELWSSTWRSTARTAAPSSRSCASWTARSNALSESLRQRSNAAVSRRAPRH